MSVPEYDLNGFTGQEEFETFVHALADAAPGLCRIGELGRSRQGRPMTLLTITDFSTGEPEEKPACYVQGMVHAHELSGSVAALYCARELLARHRENGILERVTFYIVPRVNPDGTERILESAGCIRSRLDDSDRNRPNTWFEEDINGDGLILEMRYPDPFGKWVADADDPRLLIPRTPQSQGVFYTLIPEGQFHQYDGSPVFRNGNTSIDWNRSYGSSYSPKQKDSGPYPFAEPEVRQIAEFFTAHKNIFCAFDFHNGPLQILTPPATAAGRIAPEDTAFFQSMREAGRKLSLEMSESYTYPGGIPRDLPGNFVDWCYFDLGIPGWVLELGSVVSSLVSLEDHKRIDCSRSIHGEVFKWQQAHPGEAVRLHPWQKFTHPQLGELEIGGVEWRAYSLPGKKEAADYSERALQFLLHNADCAPRLTAAVESVTLCGGNVWRLRVRLVNTGVLPTCVTGQGRTLPRRISPYAEFIPADGAECLSMNRGTECEHLASFESRYLEYFIAAPSGLAELGYLRIQGGPAGNFNLNIPAREQKGLLK